MADTRIGIKLDLNISEFAGNVNQAQKIVQALGSNVDLTLGNITKQFSGLGAIATTAMKQMSAEASRYRQQEDAAFAQSNKLRVDTLAKSFADARTQTSNFQKEQVSGWELYNQTISQLQVSDEKGSKHSGNRAQTSKDDRRKPTIYEIKRMEEELDWLKKKIKQYETGDVRDELGRKEELSFATINEYLRRVAQLEAELAEAKKSPPKLFTEREFKIPVQPKKEQPKSVLEQLRDARSAMLNFQPPSERRQEYISPDILKDLSFEELAGPHKLWKAYPMDANNQPSRDELLEIRIRELLTRFRNQINEAFHYAATASNINDDLGDAANFVPGSAGLITSGVGLLWADLERANAEGEFKRILADAKEMSLRFKTDMVSMVSQHITAARKELEKQRHEDYSNAVIGLAADVIAPKKALKNFMTETMGFSEKGIADQFFMQGAEGAMTTGVGEVVEGATHSVTESGKGNPNKKATPSPSKQSSTRVREKKRSSKSDDQKVEPTTPKQESQSATQPESPSSQPSILGPSTPNRTNDTIDREPPAIFDSPALPLDTLQEESRRASEILQQEFYGPSQIIGEEFLKTTDESVQNLTTAAETASDNLNQIEGQHVADRAQIQDQADQEELQRQEQTLQERQQLFRDAYDKISQFMSIGSNASKARSDEKKRYQEQMADFDGSLSEKHDAQVAHEQQLKEIDEQAKQERLDMVKNYLLQELAELAIQELAKLTVKTASETSQTAVQTAGAATRSGLAAGESSTNLGTAASSVVSAIANAVRWVFTTIPFPFSLGVAGAAVAAVYGLWEGARSLMGFAEGGYVKGPGTDTSDSIPARLSNNEYVLNAKSVRSIGVGALDYMNTNGALPVNSVSVGPMFGLQRPMLSSSSVDNNGALISKLDSLERTVSNLRLNAVLDQNRNNLSSQQSRFIRKEKAY